MKATINVNDNYSIALVSDGQEQSKLVYPMSDTMMQMRFVGALCDLTMAQMMDKGAEHLEIDVVEAAIRAHIAKLETGKALDFVDEHGTVIRLALCAPVGEVLH